jgi:hypothetical protein
MKFGLVASARRRERRSLDDPQPQRVKLHYAPGGALRRSNHSTGMKEEPELVGLGFVKGGPVGPASSDPPGLRRIVIASGEAVPLIAAWATLGYPGAVQACSGRKGCRCCKDPSSRSLRRSCRAERSPSIHRQYRSVGQGSVGQGSVGQGSVARRSCHLRSVSIRAGRWPAPPSDGIDRKGGQDTTAFSAL